MVGCKILVYIESHASSKSVSLSIFKELTVDLFLYYIFQVMGYLACSVLCLTCSACSSFLSGFRRSADIATLNLLWEILKFYGMKHNMYFLTFHLCNVFVNAWIVVQYLLIKNNIKVSYNSSNTEFNWIQ